MTIPLVFWKPFFVMMTFCIKNQLFCKGTSATVENLCSSVPFTPRSIASAGSPRKVSLLFHPKEISFLRIKVILYGILNAYSKNWLVTVVPQKYFWYSKKWPLVNADSHVTFYQLFFSLESTAIEKTTILSGILKAYSKTRSASAREKCSGKNNRKKLLQKSCQLGTQSGWH